MRRREDLTSPRAARRVGVQYDSDRFGAFSESLARNLGTAQFLVWQTVVIAIWIVHNALAPERYQFDPWSRGLVLLTLVLSLQASYAAPLILLAQNRQEFRDRLTAESDRNVAERTQADTEFLAREIASVRLSLSDMVTGETLDERLDERLDRLTAMIEQLSDQVASLTTDASRGEPLDDSSDGATDGSTARATTPSTSSTVNDEN